MPASASSLRLETMVSPEIGLLGGSPSESRLSFASNGLR